MKYWGHWVLEKVRKELAQFYPLTSDGQIPVSYLWARTIKCPNPTCGMVLPLIQQQWLCRTSGHKVALKLLIEKRSNECVFKIVQDSSIDFDPHSGTMQQGRASCPACETVVDGERLRAESCAGRMGEQLIAVVTVSPSSPRKDYRSANVREEEAFRSAKEALESLCRVNGEGIVPNEPMTPDRPSPNSRGLSAVVRYGIDKFGKLFNARQALAMTMLVRAIHELPLKSDSDYGKAISTLSGDGC